MTTGASDLTGGLRLFKRLYNKIVLLGPPDPDEIRGEEHPLERKIVGILLTGGRLPPVQILKEAERHGIPLILIKEDTFAALEKLGQMKPALSPKDDLKVQRFIEHLDRHADLNHLLRSLGLIP